MGGAGREDDIEEVEDGVEGELEADIEIKVEANVEVAPIQCGIGVEFEVRQPCN